MERNLLLLHAAATLYMAGLIWFVQLVHYPLLSRVGVAGYREYQAAHQSLTFLAVGPAMLVELLTAFAITPRGPLTWTGLALLAAIWACTAFVQIPLHNSLATGFNANIHDRLVATNWVRTVLWTIRSALALGLIARAWR